MFKEREISFKKQEGCCYLCSKRENSRESRELMITSKKEESIKIREISVVIKKREENFIRRWRECNHLQYLYLLQAG